MIEATVINKNLSFETSPECFAPRALDRGTLAMLSFARFEPGQKVLDLGCGYGVVGITAAQFTAPENVFLTDIDKTALRLATRNAEINRAAGVHIIESDAFEGLDAAGFDLILSNPPYHTDFSVAKRFIEKGFNRLKLGGRFLMVTKRREWYKNKFIAIFGGVRIYEADGYFVFEAVKRGNRYGHHNGQNSGAGQK
jgi:16S rRNA (guanine1207-N2)-methyltransferase